jgi:hypothetical protein
MNRIACARARESGIADRIGSNSRSFGFVPGQKQPDPHFPLFPAPMWTMNKLYRRVRRAERGWLVQGFKKTRQMRSS